MMKSEILQQLARFCFDKKKIVSVNIEKNWN